MPWQPGQSGNPEGSPKGKPWAGALRRAIAEADRDKLLEIAKTLLDKAAEGDMQAVKELGDRLDGRAPQALTLQGDEEGGPVRFKWLDG